MKKLVHSLILLTAISCKATEHKSEVSSLDNFAGSSHTVNSCQGNYRIVAGAYQIDAPKKYFGAIEKSLTAVPVNIQEAFFKDFDGTIEVVSNIKAACSAQNGIQNDSNGLLSCWQTKNENAIAIYIKEEATSVKTIQNIRHAMVRSFGYFVSEVMLKATNTENGTELVENSDMTTVKRDMAFYLLANMNANPKYDLNKVLGSIPSGAFSANKSLNENRMRWDRLRNSPRVEKFSDSVFAETFDSFYCSSESRARLQQDFGLKNFDIYESYLEIDREVEGMFSSSASLVGDEGVEDGGMSLWGRWGRGNGPLRNGFRRWGTFRQSGRGFFNFRRARAGGGFVFNHGGFGRRWR
jgi:hypothetical protein